jgi:hypothetical protein
MSKKQNKTKQAHAAVPSLFLFPAGSMSIFTHRHHSYYLPKVASEPSSTSHQITPHFPLFNAASHNISISTGKQLAKVKY